MEPYSSIACGSESPNFPRKLERTDCMLKLQRCILLMVAVLTIPVTLQARKQLFSDTFETDSSALWSVFNGSDTGTSDFTVQFSYLYTTNRYTSNGVSLTIPLAPNSATGAGRGVKVTVNKN